MAASNSTDLLKETKTISMHPSDFPELSIHDLEANLHPTTDLHVLSSKGQTDEKAVTGNDVWQFIPANTYQSVRNYDL